MGQRQETAGWSEQVFTEGTHSYWDEAMMLDTPVEKEKPRSIWEEEEPPPRETTAFRQFGAIV